MLPSELRDHFDVNSSLSSRQAVSLKHWLSGSRNLDNIKRKKIALIHAEFAEPAEREKHSVSLRALRTLRELSFLALCLLCHYFAVNIS